MIYNNTKYTANYTKLTRNNVRLRFVNLWFLFRIKHYLFSFLILSVFYNVYTIVNCKCIVRISILCCRRKNSRGRDYVSEERWRDCDRVEPFGREDFACLLVSIPINTDYNCILLFYCCEMHRLGHIQTNVYTSLSP